jgi:hypothetical protein
MEWKRKRRPRVLRGLSPRYIGWKLETRICPVKTASAVPETSETAPKIDIQWILPYDQ